MCFFLQRMDEFLADLRLYARGSSQDPRLGTDVLAELGTPSGWWAGMDALAELGAQAAPTKKAAVRRGASKLGSRMGWPAGSSWP